MALEQPANRDVLTGWVNKWAPLADAAIASYGAALPDAPGAASRATAAVRAFRHGLGV
jgi:toluene monooxygenase system protein E